MKTALSVFLSVLVCFKSCVLSTSCCDLLGGVGGAVGTAIKLYTERKETNKMVCVLCVYVFVCLFVCLCACVSYTVNYRGRGKYLQNTSPINGNFSVI